MEDRKSTAISLPPGCRFRPSEEELLRHYLAGKNRSRGGDESEDFSGVIGEIELCGIDPFELSESSSFAFGPGGKRMHWYCYAESSGLKGAKRTSKNGVWRRKGKVKRVLGSGGTECLGTKTTFAFYLGNSSKNYVKTDWVLYEYSPIDHPKASFVLCRVFMKSRRKSVISENGLVSCAEESVSVVPVRHIGIQHDGHTCSSMKDASEINYQNTESAPILKFEFPMDPDPDAKMDMDNFTDQHLLSILEDDFLELNDLVD